MSANIHCWDTMRSEGCCEIGLHDNMQKILHWLISTNRSSRERLSLLTTQYV